MVKAAEPHTFNLLIALTAGVAVAVISKDKTSCAAGDDGETTDAALQTDKEDSQTNRQEKKDSLSMRSQYESILTNGMMYV